MKKPVFFFFNILVSLGLLLYLFTNVNLSNFIGQIAKLNPLFLWVLAVVFVIQSALSSLKWSTILRADNIKVPLISLFKKYLIGNFVSLFLPTSIGGDVYRVFALKKYNGDTAQNTSSVLFDRLTGLFALVSLSLFFFIIFRGHAAGYYVLGFYIFFLIAFSLIVSDRAERYLRRLKKFPRTIINVLSSFNKYKRNREAFFKSIIISFVFQNNQILIVALLCYAMNVEISLKYIYIFVPLIYLTEAIPFSLNGLGVRDGAFVFFFLQVGHTRVEALAVSLLLISLRYLYSLIIGGPLFFRMMYKANFDLKLKAIAKNLQHP